MHISASSVRIRTELYEIFEKELFGGKDYEKLTSHIKASSIEGYEIYLDYLEDAAMIRLIEMVHPVENTYIPDGTKIYRDVDEVPMSNFFKILTVLYWISAIVIIIIGIIGVLAEGQGISSIAGEGLALLGAFIFVAFVVKWVRNFYLEIEYVTDDSEYSFDFNRAVECAKQVAPGIRDKMKSQIEDMVNDPKFMLSKKYKRVIDHAEGTNWSEATRYQILHSILD